MTDLDPRLRAAITTFATTVAPVAEVVSSSVTHVRFQEGLIVHFDRVVFRLPEGYDSAAFAYDFYHSAVQGDRYAYENLAVPNLGAAKAQGWIPVRLDVWSRQGRKSKPAKPVRLDVWFVTKHDATNQNATRYNPKKPFKYGDTGRYEGNTW